MTEDKKTLFIDGREVEFTDEPNLLEVIRKAGLNVPTFCYRPDLTSFWIRFWYNCLCNLQASF